jgi:ribonucleoside-triphosphate reductase
MYLLARNAVLKRFYDDGLLPAYNAGYIDLDKQYLTVGVNGVLEAVEDDTGKWDTLSAGYVDILSKISAGNLKFAEEHGIKMNTEAVPAESLGVKNSKWDDEIGLVHRRDCYNGFFFPVEDASWSLTDKAMVHGGDVADALDGGQALHIYGRKRYTKDQYKHLIRTMIKYNVPYFCHNVPRPVCDECCTIGVEPYETCPKCGARIKDWLERIVGYQKRVSSYSEPKQREYERRSRD